MNRFIEQTSPVVKWLVFLVGTIAISLLMMEMTILPVALPVIQKEFLATETQVQWMINAYSLSFSIFILMGGRLSDLMGKRNALILGMLIFGAASVFCALSVSSFMLISGRFIMGLGICLMYPCAFASIIHAFPENQRGKVVGLATAIGSLFIAAGPFLGGYLAEHWSWRYIFWLNIPFVLVGVILGAILLKNIKQEKTYFDFKGFVVYTIAFTFLIFALMEGTDWGWSSAVILIFFALAVLFFLLLYFVERKQEHPFFDFPLFQSRKFLIGSIGIAVALILYLSGVYWPIYFQKVLGYTSQKAGEVFMIANAPLLFIGILAGWLFDKFGAKVPMLIGSFMACFALFWTASLGANISFYLLLPGLLTYGLGAMLIGNPSITTCVGGVPREKAGVASGIAGSNRAAGGAIGIALAGAILHQSQLSTFSKLLHEDPQTANLDPKNFEGLLTKVPSAVDALKGLSGNVVHKVHLYMTEATMHSFSVTYYTIGSIGALFFVLVLFILRKNQEAK